MKKYAAILLLTLAACDLQYDAETRYIVETHIQDRNGAPIPNILVDVEARNGNDSETIADSRTDAQGNLRLTFPRPKNGSVSIFINGNRFTNSNEYQGRFIHLDSMSFSTFKFELDPVVLYRLSEITTLSIQYVDADPSFSQVRDVTLEGLNPSEDLSTVTLAGNDSYLPGEFTVVGNSTVILHYRLIDSAGVATNYNVPISIGTEPVEYTLTY